MEVIYPCPRKFASPFDYGDEEDSEVASKDPYTSIKVTLVTTLESL
jgi:hypothetical protein